MTPADLQAFIEAHGIEAEMVVPEMPTPTVETAAEAVGSSVDQIIKSVLFLVREKPVLAIASGTRRIDYRKIADHFQVGRRRVKMADRETVEQISGYPIGGVPPFGHPQPVETLIDLAVLEQPVIYGGGGDHRTLIRLAPDEIRRVTQATLLPLTGK